MTNILVNSIKNKKSLIMCSRSYTSVVNTASRGIGLEFTRQLLHKTKTERVFALCRDHSPSVGLVGLQKQFGSKLVVITDVDLEDDSSIQSAVKRVSEGERGPQNARRRTHRAG